MLAYEAYDPTRELDERHESERSWYCLEEAKNERRTHSGMLHDRAYLPQLLRLSHGCTAGTTMQSYARIHFVMSPTCLQSRPVASLLPPPQSPARPSCWPLFQCLQQPPGLRSPPPLRHRRATPLDVNVQAPPTYFYRVAFKTDLRRTWSAWLIPTEVQSVTYSQHTCRQLECQLE